MEREGFSRAERLCAETSKRLFNFDPPATDEEIRAASLQFVRKLSGFNAPSKANEEAFDRAIEEVAGVARRLIDSLTTNAAPKNREEVAARSRAPGRRNDSGPGDAVMTDRATLNVRTATVTDVPRLVSPDQRGVCRRARVRRSRSHRRRRHRGLSGEGRLPDRGGRRWRCRRVHLRRDARRSRLHRHAVRAAGPFRVAASAVA